MTSDKKQNTFYYPRTPYPVPRVMNYYHDPKYYDLSYSHDMQDELAFLKRIFSETAGRRRPRLLEPACGTGRLLVPLVRAGFNCTGFDIEPRAIDYLKKNLCATA